MWKFGWTVHLVCVSSGSVVAIYLFLFYLFVAFLLFKTIFIGSKLVPVLGFQCFFNVGFYFLKK